MEITTAKAAMDLINTARTSINNARERAQASKDAVLKEIVGNLQDTFNSLRETILRLTEENAELRRAQIEKPPKPEIRQMGAAIYYFVGEKGPYCQKCHDKNNKLVHLSPRQRYFGGPGRKCEVCETVFYE